MNKGGEQRPLLLHAPPCAAVRPGLALCGCLKPFRYTFEAH